MKKIFFTIFILLLSNWQLAHSQTVHALIYGNAKEIDQFGNNRGCDRKVDTDNMNAFFKSIANALNYQYASVVNSDKNFTSSKARRDIDNLNVEVDDIVIFYYTGHGYNDQQSIDEWPSLNFNGGNYHSTKLRKQISNNAKLILFITDCCNNFPDLPLANSDARTNNQDQYFKQNMRNLFVDFNGKKTIALTASQKGEVSLSAPCGRNDLVGSFFGIAFRKIFMSYATNRPSISWSEIIEGSKSETLKYCELARRTEPHIKNQNAYGKIYTRKDNAATTKPEQPATKPKPAAQRQPATPTAAVSRQQGAFYVLNGLGGGQIAENAVITIGNASYYLNVDYQNPQAYITFQLPNGQYNYSIRTTLRCQYGQSYRDMTCTGSGSLYFENGKTYTISSNYEACNYQNINDLHLVAK